MAILRVRKGKNPGTVYAVLDGTKPSLIGRDPSVDVSLDDTRASRKHSRILRAHGAWILQDLGSSNGTFQRGQKIDSVLIKAGSTFQIGGTLLEFQPEELAPPPETEIYGTRALETLAEEAGVFVYRSYQPALDREVRVDCLDLERDVPAAVRASLREAAEAAVSLSHPGIDSLVHAKIESEGPVFVVQRLRAGELLSEHFSELLEQSISQRLRLFRSLVEPVLTRAVRPQLASALRLSQFRLSYDVEGRPVVSLPAIELGTLLSTQTGALVHLPGYADYLAPQRLDDDADFFAATMYELGAVGYHLLTSNPPMGQKTTHRKKIEGHRNVSPAPASLVQPLIPGEISDLLDLMLSKDPGRRPSGVDDIISVLDGVTPGAHSEVEVKSPEIDEEDEFFEADAVEHSVGLDPAGRSRHAATPRRPAARASADSPPNRPESARPAADRRLRVGFFGSLLSLPLWIALWIALVYGTKIASQTLFLDRP